MSRFHEGELAVQQRAGVRAEADRLAGMLAPPQLDGGPPRFLGERTFAALTGRDAEGRLWTAPLVGPVGFLDAGTTSLRIHALPLPGDPLRDLPEGQPVGVIAMDFARRRRLRVNGVLAERGTDGLRIDVEQAFGNCPKYIRPRHLEGDAGTVELVAPSRAATLSPAQRVLLAATETFFLGTTHPERGVDTSHRGGPAGFVRVEDGALWWPDYPGNNMFLSFGNLAVDGTAAVLVPDFTAGTNLQLSGCANLEWVPPGSAGDDGGTGRRVRFTVQHVASGALPIHEEPTSPRGAAA
ncbi:MAG: pyridoxamine 5'-phosphate oxidase family protein [Pseudonocardia sp.]|nr:pyridoxamine 5'-phosphate oxidase family protein [Pseudonocardia sp.]